MRGVDVSDQLQASYSYQVRSHKWWHRIFYFLLDMTIVNINNVQGCDFANRSQRCILFSALRSSKGRYLAGLTC
jgi:hypothetical protein